MISGNPLSTRRLAFTFFSVFVLFALVIYQLVQLTLIHRPALEAIANNQHNLKVETPPIRGQIFDRQGKELATSLKIPSVYAVPRVIHPNRKAELGQRLSKILDLKYSFVEERLSRDKAFVWLKRQVSFEEAKRIEALSDPGLGILEEYKRFYPQGELGAQSLGFVNIDNHGLEGIELLLDSYLHGRPGVRYTKRDALGREIKAFEVKEIAAIHGNRVFLTMDRYLQFVMEESLDEAYRTWNAKGASAILMEATTGKILAMANRPTYDPNQFQTSTAEGRRNRAITDMYEPGSIFKIVAATAALNEGKVELSTVFDCEQGEYRYGTRVLHDVHPYGDLTFEEVIIKSSNIGIVKIASLLKPDTFQDYIERLGFGKPTGVDLLGEARGFTNPPSKWSKTSPYNIPMGHEVLVTLVQMARAMAVIANGGYLVTPYIIERIEDEAGVTLFEKSPQAKGNIIRPETAQKMRNILVRVVEEGTGRRAQVPRVKVGGKTGTAQKVLPDGKGYSQDSFMSSFVGFAPAENSKFVMAVVLDDPSPKHYGGTVAAPVFSEVIEAALMTSEGPGKDSPFMPPAKNAEGFQDRLPMLLPASR